MTSWRGKLRERCSSCQFGRIEAEFLYIEHQTCDLILYPIMEKWNKDTGVCPVTTESAYT